MSECLSGTLFAWNDRRRRVCTYVGPTPPRALSLRTVTYICDPLRRAVTLANVLLYSCSLLMPTYTCLDQLSFFVEWNAFWISIRVQSNTNFGTEIILCQQGSNCFLHSTVLSQCRIYSHSVCVQPRTFPQKYHSTLVITSENVTIPNPYDRRSNRTDNVSVL